MRGQRSEILAWCAAAVCYGVVLIHLGLHYGWLEQLLGGLGIMAASASPMSYAVSRRR